MTQALTPEQVDSFNAYQASGVFHPLTCGSGRRTDAQHLDGEGLLLATAAGIACPFCGWRQQGPVPAWTLTGAWRPPAPC